MTRYLIITLVLAASAFGSGTRNGPVRSLLPALEETGADATTYALYERDNFTARLHTDGVMRIYLKQNGEIVGKPIVFGQPAGNYYHRTKREIQRRNVAAYYDPADPIRNPKSIELTGRLEGNLSFTIKYEFAQSTIRVTGRHQQVAGIKNPIQFIVNTAIPSLASDSENEPNRDGSYKLDVPDKMLKRFVLETSELVDGRTHKKFYQYTDRNAKFSGPVKHAKIRGPWGSRTVRLRSRKMRGKLMGKLTDGGNRNYGTWGLLLGYEFFFYTLQDDEENNYASYSISIN
ncbi:MAG: hypothetical protein ACKJSG_10435 [Lentisphaeria bacterium]